MNKMIYFFVCILGSPARNKVSQTPRTPKTMPKKLAAREMSPMEDALPSPLPRKVNTRRNTMAVNASESDQLVKMVRRSARVIAKKAEWDCEDMPPPSPITTTRAMSMKKSTVKKSVRKTLICGDDGENSDATNSPSIMPQSNYVSLFGEQKPIEIEDQSKNMANCTLVNSLPTEASNESIGEKKNGTFDISNENLNNVSGTDLLTDDEKENSPSVSMLGAKLEASKIHSSDSETENLPSVSILGEQLHAPHTKHEKLPIFVEPKAKKTSEIPTPVAAQKKSRSTRKTVVRGEDANVVSDEANATRFKYAFLLKDDQRNTNENASAPDETSPQPAETLNETIGEKKNGTFDISEENVNDVAELLTEDESDAEEKQNLPSVSMLGTKPKKTQSPAIAKSDSENENLPSVSMMASASIRKNKNEQPINKRISIVDLTDSPAIKKNVSNNEVNAKESESIATEKVNDKTFSPVESTVSPKPGTTTWLTLPPAGTNKSKNMKNPSPLKVHTPFKRKSPRTSNGATKKPLTSAKKKCLLSMAKEAIAERASSKQVVFSSPAKDLTRTPNRAISMGIKKTPYKLPTEGKIHVKTPKT